MGPAWKATSTSSLHWLKFSHVVIPNCIGGSANMAPANSRDTPCCITLPCLHSCNSAHIFSPQIHGITGKFTQHSNKLGWRIKGKTNKVSKREKSSEIYTKREKSASSLLLTQASEDEASEIQRAASTDFCHVEKELSLSQTVLLSPNKGV